MTENTSMDGILRTSGRYWPIVAVALILVGGLTFHEYDLIVYQTTVGYLVSGEPLYGHRGASYFPLAWYALGIPALVLEAVGLYGPEVFPWIASGVFTSALVGAGLYGGKYLPDDADADLLMGAVLLNPLVLVGAIIWSQSDALVTIGVLVAVVSFATGHYRLFGAAVAWAAAVKLAPAFMIIPGLLIAWDHRRDIILGGAVVGVATLALVLFHDSFSLIFDTSHGLGLRGSRVWISNPLWIVDNAVSADLLPYARMLTFGGVLAGLAWSVLSDAPGEIRVLGPLAPAVVLYPAPYTYRWIPLIVAGLWLGLRHRDTEIGAVCWEYAWTASALGAAILLFDFLGPLSVLDSTLLSSVPLLGLLNPLPEAVYYHSIWLLAILHLIALVWVATELSSGIPRPEVLEAETEEIT